MKLSRWTHWATAGVMAASLPAQVLDPLVVSISRDPVSRSQQPYTVEVLSADTLAAQPALALDDKLKASAAFRLFRRSSSGASHPTGQGASLRNLGPNGAGRALVLSDGIPLNDPFGGWVAWGAYSPLDPSLVEIVRGGGSATWGSAALGGTVQLVSAPPPTANTHAAQFEIGDFGTLAGALRSTWVQDEHAWTFDASGLHRDGWHRTAPSSAGPIDEPTDLDQARVSMEWARQDTDGHHARLRLRGLYDDRGNDTPLQRNRTRQWQASGSAGGPVELAGEDAQWQLLAYASAQDFSSLFTRVDATRTSEVPVLDQYEVPASSFGASGMLAWAGAQGHTSLGIDLRWVEGETREHYLRIADAFTRERHAGGEQTSAGLWATHQRQLSREWSLDAALRVESWRLHAGHRREWQIATGNMLRDDAVPDRSGTEVSPRLGLVWQNEAGWRAIAAAYTGFRLPTLNELHRPFRVGNVVTGANPALEPETLIGAELGMARTQNNWRWRATVFWNEVQDAVANVTLGSGPGVIPGVGFVPPGGTGRQRQNLDRITSQGLEMGGTWQASPSLRLRADYLFSDATDETSGRRLPQVSRHTATLGFHWQPHASWQVNGLLRHVSDAWEDDQNTLQLDAATMLDLRVAWEWAEGRTWFVAVENVTDEAVITRRSADGRVELGTPRYGRTGVTWRW